jgi:hypothetical protein
MTVGTDNEHMVNQHHWEWHFVTPACEQIHYFIWQSTTTYCSHKSMCCEQHNLLTLKHSICVINHHTVAVQRGVEVQHIQFHTF